jgi:hypothetical protein
LTVGFFIELEILPHPAPGRIWHPLLR